MMTAVDESAPKPPKWRYSKAKKLLLKDIHHGTITSETNPKVVHHSRPEFEAYKFNNFRATLKRYLKQTKEQTDLAEHEADALAHDEALGLRIHNKPYPRWQGTQAEAFLKADISQNLQVNQKPKELWVTRPEYKAYPLNVFRDHIQQELRARRERPYWMARRAEKEAEKAKSSSETKKTRSPPKLLA